MTIPFGRLRLILTVVPSPHPSAPDIPAALGATDAELVRLSANRDADLERARREAMALTYGPRLA